MSIGVRIIYPLQKDIPIIHGMLSQDVGDIFHTLDQFVPCDAADFLLWAECLNMPATAKSLLLEEHLISKSSSTHSHHAKLVSVQLGICFELQALLDKLI